MKVKFQYVDWTEWVGPPEQAHESPDKGVIRMYGITDDGRETVFVYDDFYYLYAEAPGVWILGSGTPKRLYRFTEGKTTVLPLPVEIPSNAVLRRGQTVSQDEAVRFGLIDSPTQKTLHDKTAIPVECKTCGTH